MAPNVTVAFWAANDINGDPILTVTDEDEYFKGLKLTPDLYSVGGWELVLARNINFALFDSGAVQPEVFVRFLVHAYSDSTWYYGGVLQKRQQDVIHRDEAGAEEFVFGGPGPKQYLERYRLEIDQLTGSGWLLDLEAGVWEWGETAKAGGVLQRLYDEDQAHSNPAMPDLTIAFDQTDDSDSNPWTDDIATDGSFSLPIGNSFLQTVWDLEDLASLYTTIHLGTVASPQYELNAFETFGDDNSGSSFGSGVGLLREGVNIANDALQVQGVSFRKATHVIVEGKDGVWEKVVKPTFTPGGYVKWEKISYPRSNSPAILEKAGLRWLRRQDAGAEEFTIEIVPGDDPDTGYYFPAPNDPIWIGNTISLDTTADGSTHSPLDYNNDPFVVTGLELVLGPASEDATADQQAKSWDIKVRLNGERGGNAGLPGQGSPGTGEGNCHCGNHTHDGGSSGGGGGSCEVPPVCEEQEPDTETILSDSRDGDWGSTVTTGSCWGGDPHRLIGGSGQLGPSGGITVTAGDIIRGTVNFRDETGNDAWENVDSYNYEAALQFNGTGVATLTYPIINERFHNAGCIDVTRSITATVPGGYDNARVKIFSRLGGYQFNGWISEVTFAETPENDPYCIDAAVPTDSPYCLPSDAIEYLIENHDPNVGQLRGTHVNNSGADLETGDIVIPDLSTLDGVTTTTSAAQTDSPVGIVLAGNTDGNEVLVGWVGLFNDVNYGGATPAAGDYLFTSTTGGEADLAAARAPGAFGQLQEDGGEIQVHLWGTPDPAVPTHAHGGTGFEIVRKTADETLASSTTLQDDNHLFFAMGANEVWYFETEVIWNGPDPGDIKFFYTVPSGAVVQVFPLGNDGANAVIAGGVNLAAAAWSGSSSGVGSTGSNVRHQRHTGYVTMSSTAGNLQLQWAQNASALGTLTVMTNSLIKLLQLA